MDRERTDASPGTAGFDNGSRFAPHDAGLAVRDGLHRVDSRGIVVDSRGISA